MKNPFKKDYVLGLDIGSTSVKMAQFKESEGLMELVRADTKEIAPYGDDAHFEKEAVAALRHLLRGVDAKRARVIAGINCPGTAIKKIVAPYMPKSELKQGIALEAKSYFPFSIEDSMLDFEILADIVDKGIRKYDLLVAVSPVTTVQKSLSILKKAGVQPSSLVTSSYALGKAAEYMNKGGQPGCFIDIGSSHTELVIYKGNGLVFTRKIPVCGDDFTKSMTGCLVSDRGRTQLTFDEAEKIKKDIGIPADNDTRVIDDKIPATQILFMLRAPAENLANEINRCLDYYREESRGARVDNIVLFGGGASLTGLTGFISDILGIPVGIGDPLEGLRMEKDALRERDKKAHMLELAIGAGLSNSKGINLLPPQIKEEAQRIVKRGTFEAIVTAIAVVSILLLVGMNIKIDNFKKRIHVAKLELTGLGPQLEDAHARRIADMALVNEPYWEDIFRELGSLIPNEMSIDSMRLEDKMITMKGIVTSVDGQQMLGDFIMSLETGVFNNVKLVESKNLADGSVVEFELKCWIDYER
ncbi:MAG: type IV pilus assembly protein PilM [Candidatus Omnitrophota bacterium]|nr:type IV pilus assembly protein PilM [Candidatus Omnitrophota bacterium]